MILDFIPTRWVGMRYDVLKYKEGRRESNRTGANQVKGVQERHSVENVIKVEN